MSTPFHLHDKTILVTGASSGIGRQMCVSASRMGAKIVLSGQHEKRLAETLSMLDGNDHSVIQADLLRESEREKLSKEMPAVDGLVHCAGFVHSFPTRFLNQAKIDETLNINYEAPVLLMAHIQREKKLNRNASLVFVSSICAQHPHRGGAMYGSSKAALETFVKVLALELADKGIRANCLSPAMVKTPMYDKAEQDASKEMMEQHTERYLLGVGEPEDVANAAIYLLSPASKWITGINITLDGGLQLGGF
jgi:NAD(P)-dependent dehydrogenase (short-subunit alcohol dehydrogenase family)